MPHPLLPFLHLLSPAGQRGRLTILIYHRVRPAPDPVFPTAVDAAAFDWQMGLLKEHFNVLPLREAAAALRRGRLPARAAAITFDDGYADNAEVALPILRRHGLPATFFVASGFLDGGRMWNDTVVELVRRHPGERLDLSRFGLGVHAVRTPQQKLAAIRALLERLKYRPPQQRLAAVDAIAQALGTPLPDNLMMTSDQVRLLHREGMEIGGHTVNHPILAALSPREARAEMAVGKAMLEDITGAPVRSFAYPNGKPGMDYTQEHVRMVAALGFETAVSTRWGAARMGDDVLELPRFTPWNRTASGFLYRLARNFAVPPAPLRAAA